jgi:protein-tyrosine phosphatase
MLDGAPNFRDLGGMPVERGHVRPGMLFRSEAPIALTPDGRSTLGQLDVSLVCDLRTLAERTAEPTRWPATTQILAVDDGIDLYGTTEEEIRRIYGDHTGTGAVELLTTWYAEMPRVYEPILRQLFACLAEGRAPAVVHCSAGKDRTGFVTAALLLAIGASGETVEEDYLETDRFFAADRLAKAIRQRIGQEPPTRVVQALRVHTRYLSAALGAAETTFGSFEEYLRHLGVNQSARHRIRRTLVVEQEGDHHS